MREAIRNIVWWSVLLAVMGMVGIVAYNIPIVLLVLPLLLLLVR
jgi:hypothetical protein